MKFKNNIDKVILYYNNYILPKKNKILLFLIVLLFSILSAYILKNYLFALKLYDFYAYTLVDGKTHVNYLYRLVNDFSFDKIHFHEHYFNNYYLASLVILKLIKIFSFEYYHVGLSFVIINLLSILTILITSYYISLNLSKSWILSIAICLFLWNKEMINISLDIYPDIFQLALMFTSVFFLTTNLKEKYFYSIIFASLSFGVKAQGLLIFVYIMVFYSIVEIKKNNFKLKKKYFFDGANYTFMFFVLFFLFNHIDFFEFFKSLIPKSDVRTVKADVIFDNYELTKLYFLRDIFQKKEILYLFFLVILINMVTMTITKNNNYFFIITLVVIILFFIQIIKLPKIVQGSRYLYHFLPLMVILISISFGNLSSLLQKIKLEKIFSFFCTILLILSCNLFYKNFNFSIKKINFESNLNADDMYKSYKKISEIIPKKKNPLVCASYYAAIPSQFSSRIFKDYKINNIKEVKDKQCDYVALDSNATGRYIWFKNNVNNLKIYNFSQLSPLNQKIGKDKFLELQQLVLDLINNSTFGYKVVFFNSKMIFLEKTIIN